MPTSIDDIANVLLKLYHSGAYPCLVIAVLFFSLRYASNHVAWLEQPKQRAYATAALTALAMLVPTALAGTTPNLGQIISALLAGGLAYVRPDAAPKPVAQPLAAGFTVLAGKIESDAKAPTDMKPSA